MANSNAFSAVPDEYVEERLLAALFNGPLEQNEGLLDCLEEVDVRLVKHRTLLHVGVGLGKVDWVEELLARGADPNLEDDNHSTAMSSAEEMLGRDPEDSERRQVRRLVRMVHRRDQVMRCRLPTSASSGAASTTPPVLQSDHMSSMAAFSSSVDALKAELRSSLQELKVQLWGRDELLRCLETSVTSSAELLTSLSGRVQGENTLGAVGTTLETPLPLSNMADERRECVDGMMRRTEVVYGGEEGVRLVRKLYERLYDEDDATKCLLTFLHRESQFMAKVDCDSSRIKRIKRTFVDFDGTEWSGSNGISFAEFSSNTVYLGAKVDGIRSEEYVAGWLVWALAQMSLHLCFKNGGKPYKDGDTVCESEWKRAIEEAEKEKRKRGHGLHDLIRFALNKKTQAARESYLAACVPQIIAYYGSNDGTRVLHEQVPLLLRYFKEHVAATLLAKARELLQLQQRSLGPSASIRTTWHTILNYFDT